LKLRERYGDERIKEYFQKYAWDDPVNFITHNAPSAVFLQYGRRDEPITEKMARRAYERLAEPKKIGFYDAGHALDSAARRERVEWLAQRLSLKSVDWAALARIPELK